MLKLIRGKPGLSQKETPPKQLAVLACVSFCPVQHVAATQSCWKMNQNLVSWLGWPLGVGAGPQSFPPREAILGDALSKPIQRKPTTSTQVLDSVKIKHTTRLTSETQNPDVNPQHDGRVLQSLRTLRAI